MILKKTDRYEISYKGKMTLWIDIICKDKTKRHARMDFAVPLSSVTNDYIPIDLDFSSTDFIKIFTWKSIFSNDEAGKFYLLLANKWDNLNKDERKKAICYTLNKVINFLYNQE